ncbi:hypothetical protein LR48_Vigan148s001900 [Vigna angularis]|uniref:Putative plant transposon protein domain-containing protein n=1 Tax=Phaseolus angularis TaxID=3914 RepID=A0A0L9T4X5_PHAAN|nr:hypothetical protein LR48_Vigan148s001900 [Vigna angularis]
MVQSQFWQVAGPFDRPSPQQWSPPQQWQQQPFLSGSLDRLEDTLQRFLKNSDATQKSIEESCKRMEMQLRYISQRLNDEVNTEVNLKEEGQTIVTERNDWGKLATYPTPANIAVVKEFYTYARKIGDYPAENYLGYVRGHAIRYDPDSINNLLDTVWAGEQCQFALCMEEGADFDDVERFLCVPGGHFQRNRTGSVVNIRRTDLTPLAKYWMAFSQANIQPCSHVSDITLSRALLLYCAIRNLNVNIGQIIPDEIRMCANTTNSKAPLGHPSLITHLCKIAEVDTFVPPFERPRKAIDEAYYRQYCGGEEAARPVPPRRTRRERGQAQIQASAETHEAEPFQMRDMYMSLIGAQLQSIHKGQVATAEMIAHRWTMEEFHNVVAWPEEQVQGDRAEAAEASAMEMEEEDANDDEDDAFDDAEDEEEEEDTDDSSD